MALYYIIFVLSTVFLKYISSSDLLRAHLLRMMACTIEVWSTIIEKKVLSNNCKKWKQLKDWAGERSRLRGELKRGCRNTIIGLHRAQCRLMLSHFYTIREQLKLVSLIIRRGNRPKRSKELLLNFAVYFNMAWGFLLSYVHDGFQSIYIPYPQHDISRYFPLFFPYLLVYIKVFVMENYMSN